MKNKKPTPGGAGRPKIDPKNIGRLLKMLFRFYPVRLPLTICLIVFSAIVSAIPALFMQNVISLVEQSWQAGDWAAVSGQIFSVVLLLGIFYVLSLTSNTVYQQMMAIITQGSLKKLRQQMFEHMQELPIRYFDRHGHGDIMSHYTNDIDTLR